MQNLNRVIELYELKKASPNQVLNYCSPESLQQELALEIGETGCNDEALMKHFEDFLNFSPKTYHPQFNNQLYGGFNEPAFLAEVLSFLTNTSMATFEISPVATLMEKQMVKLIANFAKFSTYDGTMLTGGSNANMMAIHCARVAKSPGFNKKGIQSLFAIFVSEEAHYSFTKAAMLLGMGTDSVYKVKVDEKKKISSQDLERKIKAAKVDGRTPLLLATTSGTTVYGAFDNIRETNKLAKEYQLWHHVDGAWGGVAIFNSELYRKMDGIELADSFAIDFHKLFGTGLITSFLITKDQEILERSCDSDDGQYLFHKYEAASYDLGKKTVQCGKKNDALKAWAFCRSMGTKGLSKIIDEAVTLRNYTVKKISNNKNFDLLHDPEFLNICFRSRSSNSEERRYQLIREGKAMINFSTDKEGLPFVRLTLANNKTQKKDIDQLLDWLI